MSNNECEYLSNPAHPSCATHFLEEMGGYDEHLRRRPRRKEV